MLNPYSPPVFGAAITPADPEGHDSNFLWDTSAYSMLAITNNRVFATGLTAQGASNTCTARSFKEACSTLMNRAGTPMEFSWASAYMGGWAQLRGGLGWPMPMNPDPGLAGGALPLLQWAALHGCLTVAEWPDSNGFMEPSLAEYEAGRTIDFATVAPQHLAGAIRGAASMGLPVLLDTWVEPAFFNVGGPLATHAAQYSRPGGVSRVPPNILHNIAAIDVTPDYVVCANHSGPSFGDSGFIALDFPTLLACVQFAHVITRIGEWNAPAVPPLMVARVCPGREEIGPQFTLNVRNFMRNAFFDPAYGTQQQRAAATLQAMSDYGVTREEVCFSTPVDRATLDAFLALA